MKRKALFGIVFAICLVVVFAVGYMRLNTPAYAPVIDRNNFVAKIDNRYFPLKPGTTFIYEGAMKDGTERIELYVSNQTKVILGVTCVVVRDRVTVNGELAEETYDWYAQDRNGNVWYFGEDAKEYKNGVVVGTKGSWTAGVNGAQPGIIMRANPKVGDVYRQEYYKGEAEDMAEVVSLKEPATVPYGSFEGCLMTKEWTALEPGAVAHKYYAPGVGLVLETIDKDGSPGRVELVAIKTE